jgi:uncharacterized coiled-coil DUF342 family protein
MGEATMSYFCSYCNLHQIGKHEQSCPKYDETTAEIIERLTIERDECRKGMYANAVEIKELNVKITELLNKIAVEKAMVRFHAKNEEQNDATIATLTSERDALRAATRKVVEAVRRYKEYLYYVNSDSGSVRELNDTLADPILVALRRE